MQGQGKICNTTFLLSYALKAKLKRMHALQSFERCRLGSFAVKQNILRIAGFHEYVDETILAWGTVACTQQMSSVDVCPASQLQIALRNRRIDTVQHLAKTPEGIFFRARTKRSAKCRLCHCNSGKVRSSCRRRHKDLDRSFGLGCCSCSRRSPNPSLLTLETFLILASKRRYLNI